LDGVTRAAVLGASSEPARLAAVPPIGQSGWYRHILVAPVARPELSSRRHVGRWL